MLSDPRTDELIRQALAAEADRAPSPASVLSALEARGTARTKATTRRANPDRRRRVGVAAAVLATATAIILGTGLVPFADGTRKPLSTSMDGGSPSPRSPSDRGSPEVAGDICTNALVMAGISGLSVGWLPTGWVPANCLAYHDPSAPVSLSWMHAGGMPNFEPGLTLTVGSAAQPTAIPTRMRSQHFDGCGLNGTLRVATEQVGNSETTLYDDDLWWSPRSGVVVTVSMTRQSADPAADLVQIACSVGVTDVAAGATGHILAMSPMIMAGPG